MSNYSITPGRYLVNGQPVLVNVIQNPTIDDVLITEARIAAYEVESGPYEYRKPVSRKVRDYLIRLYVER